VTKSLQQRGWEAHAESLPSCLCDPARWSALEERFLSAEVVLLSSPLYVDSLPGETTLALERLAPLRTECEGTRRLVAIVNCGFLEAHQNDVALAICRLFAREAGMHWSGGLAIGAGGAIGGQAGALAGGQFAHVVRALDQVADAIATDCDLPRQALEGVRRPMCPLWLYSLMGNAGMLWQAQEHRVLFQLHAQPYRRAT
jgi:hypothetical protein